MKKQGKGKRSKSRKRPPPSVEASARQRAAAGTAAKSRSQGPRPARASANTTCPSKPLLAARTLSGIEARDDRLALALLMAPFLIVALSLGAERAARHVIARVPQYIAAAQPPSTQPDAMPLPQPQATSRASPERTALLRSVVPDVRDRDLAPPTLPPLTAMIEPPPAPLSSLSLMVEPRRDPLPMLTPVIEPAPLPLAQLSLLVEPPSAPLTSLALLVAKPPASLPIPAPLIEQPVHLPPLALLEIAPPAPSVCTAKPPVVSSATPLAPSDPAAFGLALAAAARAQTRDFVIYNNKYLRISYPMGDVPALFGVCTDVIVRAYRSLGVDLQALIQETGSGRGDRNIDHRRVEVVRRFLAKHGASLPVSDLAEDYWPGDIVTYYRPQNRGSTSHIALVTDQVAPSGRLMIVHNRGWGPELEDALFVDAITGHYRFTGMASGDKTDAAPQKRRVARR